MDFLDYREQLGIGFCDERKFEHFLTKIYNILAAVEDSPYGAIITENEYFSFCNQTGTPLDSRKYTPFQGCISVLQKHDNSLQEFLSYYIAFVNSIHQERQSSIDWNRENFANIVCNMLKESHIPFDLIENEGEYFVFPKGVSEFDDALVSQPLEWLTSYPKAHTAFVKALKEYSEVTFDNASNVADKFRKALETFFQEFFGGGRSLEKYVSNHTYEQYLDKCGVPADIRCEFKNTVSSYTKFINNNAKHHDKTKLNMLEYLMYQTGNIIRFLITLRQEEQTHAN